MSEFDAFSETQIELTLLPPGEEGEFVYEKPETPHELLAKIGEGAMGQIHLAKETDLLRRVAFKTLHEESSQDASVLGAFVNEVQITAQLDHPNIVPIYSMEKTEDDSIAYSMKLVQGQTLKDLVMSARAAYKENRPVPEDASLPSLLERFLDLCDAVHYAHSKEIIHRDLKPSNVMLGPYNELYLMDWGIARPIGPGPYTKIEITHETWPSEEGVVIGTPRYLSPEQALGQNVKLDGRSDQFALGAILFELVCLKAAFKASSQAELLRKIIRGQREPFTHAFDAYPIPKALQAIIAKATATRRRERYATVDELAQDIRRYQRGEAILARPDTSTEKALRWLNRHQQWALAGLLAVICISATVLIVSQLQQNQALQQTQFREQRRNALMTQVFRQSQKIDTHFLKVEQALEGLEAVTRYLLLQGEPSDEPIQLRTQFNPPDLVFAPYYNLKVSPDWVITMPSYNASFSDFEKALKKVLPTRHHLRRMFSQDLYQAKLMTRQQQREAITQKGGAIIWMTIVLNEGVSLGYPGTDFSGDFDGRQRPYYFLAANKRGNYWGNPYVDVTGRGLMLPSARSIFDEKGEFRGVVAVDTIFDYIISELLTLPNAGPEVIKSYLLDDKAQVVVSSDQKAKFREDKSKAYQDFELPVFDNAKVVQAVKDKRSGQMHVQRQGRDHLLLYYRMDTIGWYYVVEADIQTLFAKENP